MEKFFKDRTAEISAIAIALQGQAEQFAKMVSIIEKVRRLGGKLFFCGVGGGAGNGTHAAGDLFKSCNIKTVCLTDNIPTLTAFTNDEGWPSVFAEQLKIWDLDNADAVFIFSVGGGDVEKNISANIVNAIDYAKERGAKILGVVGKETGYTAKQADAVIVVPNVNPDFLTTHTEGMQSYVAHILTEALRKRSAKWESVEKK